MAIVRVVASPGRHGQLAVVADLSAVAYLCVRPSHGAISPAHFPAVPVLARDMVRFVMSAGVDNAHPLAVSARHGRHDVSPVGVDLEGAFVGLRVRRNALRVDFKEVASRGCCRVGMR